eukprot:g1498.t1
MPPKAMPKVPAKAVGKAKAKAMAAMFKAPPPMAAPAPQGVVWGRNHNWDWAYERPAHIPEYPSDHELRLVEKDTSDATIHLLTLQRCADALALKEKRGLWELYGWVDMSVEEEAEVRALINSSKSCDLKPLQTKKLLGGICEVYGQKYFADLNMTTVAATRKILNTRVTAHKVEASAIASEKGDIAPYAATRNWLRFFVACGLLQPQHTDDFHRVCEKLGKDFSAAAVSSSLQQFCNDFLLGTDKHDPGEFLNQLTARFPGMVGSAHQAVSALKAKAKAPGAPPMKQQQQQPGGHGNRWKHGDHGKNGAKNANQGDGAATTDEGKGAAPGKAAAAAKAAAGANKNKK